ncbi:hypothetical protein D3C75_684830 [compost metagenome]
MAAVGPKGKFLKQLRTDQALPFTGYSQADSLRAVNNYYTTTYRAATTRTAVLGGWASDTLTTDNWGYDARGTGTNYGTIDSTAPIFGNQIVCYFSNYKEKSNGKSSFGIAFTRTDNATQVAGNFSGRRVQLADSNGTVVFDQDVSTATQSNAAVAGSLNIWVFRWEIPSTFMKTGGATWDIRVV